MDIASFCQYGDLEWHGCYGSGSKYLKYTIPESVSHPAKMSWELLERIFKHLESMNLFTPDSVVIDFMAGSGRTGTMAALRGYRTISVELEPHFIEMIAGYDCDGKSISDFRIEPCACKSDTLHKPHKITTGLFEVECSGNPRIVPVCRCGDRRQHKKHHIIGNKELLERVTGRKVKWDILQGDARDLHKILKQLDVPLAGIISPPYQDTAMPMGCSHQIRNLAREGDWDKAIELEGKYEADQAKKGNKFGVSTDETIRKKIEMALEREMGNYSENPDNIGNLKDIPLVGIMSLPYSEAQQGGGIAINGYRGIHMHEMGKNQPDKVGQRCGYMKKVHGSDPGNIGNLHDNNGNQQGESYLSAMFKVYQQAYLCGISPICVVVKNPTRAGKLRRLDLDTVWLLQHCHEGLKLSDVGYEIFDYHRAILFETHTQSTLDGDSKDVHKGRISFFKRLSLEKGTTVAQWEDIIFARIPSGD